MISNYFQDKFTANKIGNYSLLKVNRSPKNSIWAVLLVQKKTLFIHLKLEIVLAISSFKWIKNSDKHFSRTKGNLKWNEWGFKPPLCTYRLNWARRTSWGWWDEWDDTALQTRDSKFEPWRFEVNLKEIVDIFNYALPSQKAVDSKTVSTFWFYSAVSSDFIVWHK